MKTRDDILGDWQIPFFLGIAGFFFGFFMLFIGLLTSMVGRDSFWDSSTLFMVYLCFPIAFIPGLIMFAIGLKLRKKDKGLEDIGNWLKTYRRIKIFEVARKLGVSEFEAEKTIARCVDKGYVKGYFDRGTGEFFTEEGLKHILNIKSCTNCGGPTDQIHLVGETLVCKYCNAKMSR